MNSPHLNVKGMTLIELLMSFAILMAGLVCIFALLLAGTSSHRRAIKETEATLLAGSILADLRAEFARGVVPDSDNAAYKDIEDRPGYQFNRLIFPVDPKRGETQRRDGREFFVRVRVRWSEKGDNQFIEFNTVMFRGSLTAPRPVSPP
jgi:type II secretory pathway pseudopilin PulG